METKIETFWIIRALKKIKDLGSLPFNWDSYGASTIGRSVCSNASNFLKSISNIVFQEPQIFPLADGGIQIELINENKELEIEFLENNIVGYLQIEDEEKVFEEELSLSDFQEKNGNLIKWLKE